MQETTMAIETVSETIAKTTEYTLTYTDMVLTWILGILIFFVACILIYACKNICNKLLG